MKNYSSTIVSPSYRVEPDLGSVGYIITLRMPKYSGKPVTESMVDKFNMRVPRGKPDGNGILIFKNASDAVSCANRIDRRLTETAD